MNKHSTCLGLAIVIAGGLSAVPAEAGTPAHGAVYVGVAYGEHKVYRVEYDYDGADTFTVSQPEFLATLPGAADYAILPNRYLLVVGQGAMAKVKLPTGSYTVASPMNNGNTITVDPGGATAWVGWKDTPISSVPLQPFGNGTTHAVTGDDFVATQTAFAPNGSVFYTTGGEFELGNVGLINLAGFTTTRLFTATEATTIHYDPFSGNMIFAAFGKAHQIDPDNPDVVISSRDDSASGENYLGLIPDGEGHLLATRWGGGEGDGALVLIDYSASGLLDDPATRIFAVPMLGGLSGSLAYDPVIFADGFEPPDP